jgi:hypothetical protein
MAKSKKSLPALSKLGLAYFTDVDCRQFMSLVELRGSKDKLYSFADRIQAGMIVNAIMTIQGIYKGVTTMVDGEEKDFSVDDYNKLVNSLNRAIASINTSLNHLGITGKDRSEPPETDALAAYLATVHDESELPPILQESYISAKKEVERLSGDRGESGVADEDEELVNNLRIPLTAHSIDDPVEKKDDKVIDVEVEEVVLR